MNGCLHRRLKASIASKADHFKGRWLPNAFCIPLGTHCLQVPLWLSFVSFVSHPLRGSYSRGGVAVDLPQRKRVTRIGSFALSTPKEFPPSPPPGGGGPPKGSQKKNGPRRRGAQKQTVGFCILRLQWELAGAGVAKGPWPVCGSCPLLYAWGGGGVGWREGGGLEGAKAPTAKSKYHS